MKRFSLVKCLRDFLSRRSSQSTALARRRSRRSVTRFDSHTAIIAVESLEDRCLLSIVTGVVTSGSGIVNGNGDLNAGDTAKFTVNFDSKIFVDTTKGLPALSLNDGATATYAGGSGTSSLAFVYTVAAGENTNDLSIIGALNGDSVVDEFSNDANFSLATNPTGILQVDTLLPYVQSIDFASPAGPTAIGSTVSFSVTFSEDVANVDVGDFKVTATGTLSATSLVVTPVSESAYTVKIGGITGFGQLGLNLVDNGTVRDLAGNALTNPNAAPSFGTQQTFAVGGGASQVWVGDINGDGIADIVANGDADLASTTKNVIDVLIGNGNGTFKPQKTYAAGNNPNSFVVADLNGDGKPDIATANYGDKTAIDNTISILINKGDGTFKPQVKYSTGSYPIQIAVGDLNNDGTMDLISANVGGDPYGLAPGNPPGNTVSILYGNGNGSFQPQQTLAVGTSPYWVAVGDLNGDGRVDLAVANRDDNSVSVLLNNGGGAFQPQQTYGVGMGPTSVAIADLDNDGRPDLITANRYSGTVSVLMGDGGGTFQPQQFYSVGPTPITVIAADLNGDGLLDLAVSNAGNDTVGVLQGNGNGTFQEEQEYLVGSVPLSVQAGSLRGNGKVDLVVATTHQHPPFAASTGSILLNNVSGDFAGPTYKIAHPPAVVTSVTTAGMGIVSGAGNINVGHQVTFTVNFDQPEYVSTAAGVPYLKLNDGGIAPYAGGSGTSALKFVYTAAAGDNTTDLSVFSFNLNGATIKNGDGFDAVLSGALTNPSGTLLVDTVLPYVQSIVFASPTSATATGPSVSYAVTFSEPVTGVVPTSFQAITSGSVGNTAITVTPLSNKVYTVTVGGITGVGKLGLNLVDYGSIRDLAGNGLTSSSGGGASFLPQQSYLVNAGASQIWVGDLNGDSIPDIVSNGGDVIDALIGKGDGTFKTPQTFAVGANPNSFAVADLNGDGKPDVVAANYGNSSTVGNSISVLLGNGDGTFKPQQTYATGAYPISVTIADLNGDGKPDVIATNFGGNPFGRASSATPGKTVSVFMGNGDGTLATAQSVAVGNSPYWVSTGDVNGDGKTDLAVANAFDNRVGVLLGNGDGTFQPQKTFFTGLYPNFVTMGDVNGDGKADLVVTNRLSNTIGVLLGNGNGTFQTQTTFATGASPTSVAISDINGDGRADLIVANASGNKVGVLLGNGNGTFQSQQSFAAGLGTRSAAAIDLNGDGRPDIVTADTQQRTPGSGTIYLSSFGGNFTGPVYNIVSGPTVAGPTITNVTAASAILGGTVTADGGLAITNRGIVYVPTSISINPVIGGAGVINVPVTGTTGAFTTTVNGLVAGKSYAVAAYATNANGTFYSPISTFTAAFGAPTQLVLTTPLPQTVPAGGSTGQIVVQVRDQLGNLVSNDNGRTIRLQLNGQTIATATDLNGLAVFNSIPLTQVGTAVITISSANLTSVVNTIIVPAGAPTHLAMMSQPVPPSGASANIGAQLTAATVAIQDAQNNIVTSNNSPITYVVNTLSGGAPGGGNPLSGTPTIVRQNGVTTLTKLAFAFAGTYSITFKSASLPGVQNVTTNVIRVVAPTQGPSLAIVKGLPSGNVTAGTAIAPAVTVSVNDSAGKVMTNDSSIVTLTITGGGTFANGQTKVSAKAVHGIATFSGLTFNAARTYTLTATDNGSGFSNVSLNVGTVNVVAAAATKLVFQPTVPASLPVGSTTPAISAVIQDRFGNVVVSDNASQITLKLNGAIVATVTARSGVATFSGVVITKKGLNSFVASRTGLTSSAFSLTGK